MDKSATISPCGLFRYDLLRVWRPSGGLVNFIGLNPSTADAQKDDPTIRRCRAFAIRWGYGGFVVTNLFAFRSTDPQAMKRAADPVGPENDAYLSKWSRNAAVVVAAWGNHGAFAGRGDKVRDELLEPPVSCFRMTKQGQPEHPLYQPTQAILIAFKTLHI